MPSKRFTEQTSNGKHGFTIVELLIVVVVIAILAAVVIVAYNGIRQQSVDTSINSDLKNAATYLELERVKTNRYPDNQSNLPKSDSISYQYDYNNETNPPSYCLTATSELSSTAVFHISSETGTPQEGPCDGHHGPIVYTYDFSMRGGTSTSSSSAYADFTWDTETIYGLEYQRYLLYGSCTADNPIINSGDPEIIENSLGSGSKFISWGNLNSFGHDSIGALWVRVRPVDSNRAPLAGWSVPKGIIGRYDNWNSCDGVPSPWTSPPTITIGISSAIASKATSADGTAFRAGVTHYARTNTALGTFNPTGVPHWNDSLNYRIRYEKIVYKGSECVASSPLSVSGTTGNVSSYGLHNNHPNGSTQGISLSNTRVDTVTRPLPHDGVVWARAMVIDANDNSLSSWSEPYGALAIWDLESEGEPTVSTHICSNSNLPPANHWPSAQ